jgi:ABC-2 type transport system permease protein
MQYSQLRAMWAITKGSLRAITRSPSAMIFSFIFPFIFILVFGFIGGGSSMQSFKVVIDKHSDTSNVLYQAISSMETIKVMQYASDEEMKTDLNKGRLAGILLITKNTDATANPYSLVLKSTTSSNDKWPQLKSMLENTVNKISNSVYKNRQSYADFNFNPQTDIETVREYKTIDFILPGQLGFSLLSAGVFGVAFMFFNLRNTLVLKRFFATPINRTFIILGEGLSRVIFQLITAVVIISVGYFFFGFTLIHGFRTFFDMMVLSFFGLLVFMGFGFIVSGIAKSDSTIPPFANLITLPQFLIGGTFFSIDSFPKWLQPISKAMPLTHLNTALRNVAFEGQSLWQVKSEILILIIWGVVVYGIAVKVFKWE